MGTMHQDELLKLWRREEISIEMAIGHLLQNLAKIQTVIEAGNISLYQLRADVDSLIAQIIMPPATKNKKHLNKT